MRKVLAFSLVFFFVMMSASTSVAKPAVETDNGPVFGGQHSDINNQSNQTAKISLLQPLLKISPLLGVLIVLKLSMLLMSLKLKDCCRNMNSM